MNEKLSYATMLEMPVTTSSVTVKPAKKRKRRLKPVDTEAVKNELIEKVNAQPEQLEDLVEQEQSQELVQEQDFSSVEVVENTATVKPMPKKNKLKNFKVSVIGVQFALIGALVATIFLTSALNANSGINVFFRNAFGTGQSVKVDERTYQEFKPVIALDSGEYAVDGGIMTITAKGSVYSPCDGKILSKTLESNGKYTVEIEHSKNFKSVFTGLDFVYGEQGGAIYGNIPVGYLADTGATMCFTGADGSIITGYQIIDNSVVWAV